MCLTIQWDLLFGLVDDGRKKRRATEANSALQRARVDRGVDQDGIVLRKLTTGPEAPDTISGAGSTQALLEECSQYLVYRSCENLAQGCRGGFWSLYIFDMCR